MWYWLTVYTGRFGGGGVQRPIVAHTHTHTHCLKRQFYVAIVLGFTSQFIIIIIIIIIISLTINIKLPAASAGLSPRDHHLTPLPAELWIFLSFFPRQSPQVALWRFTDFDVFTCKFRDSI